MLVQRTLSADRTRERLRFAVLLGVCLGCSVLGGFPQILPYFGVCGVVYGATVLLQDRRPTRQGLALEARRALIYGGLAAVVMVGIAACLLIPALEFLEHSPRAGGSGTVVEGYEAEDWGFGYGPPSTQARTDEIRPRG